MIIIILSNITKTIMFFASYIPLYIILFIQYYDFNDKINNQPLLILLIIIIIACLVLFITIFYIIKNKLILHETIKIKNVKKTTDANLTYLLTNIVPLIAFDFSNRQQLSGFLIIFFMLWLMYVKYGLIIYNPIAEIFGYTNYSAEIYKNNICIRNIYIITKQKLETTNSPILIKGIELNDDFWIGVNSS